MWNAINEEQQNKTLLEKCLCGRTPLGWVKLLLFYAVFYIVLAALWMGCWCVFYSQINEITPYRKYPDTFPKPGLHHIPTDEGLSKDDTISESMVEDFFKNYNDNIKPKENCNFSSKINHTAEFCKVDTETLRKICTDDLFVKGHHDEKENKVTYCKLFKTNKLYGWEPDYYTDKDTAPEELKNIIGKATKGEEKRVWVTCEGAVDNEPSMKIDFEFTPKEQGLPGYYFPFLNPSGYQSPLILVKYKVPFDKRTKITCTLWAKDLKDATTSFRHHPEKEAEK